MLKNLSIRIKFALPLVFILALLLLVGIGSIIVSNTLAKNVSNLNDHHLKLLDTTLNADRDLYQALTASQNYIYSSNADKKAEYLASFQENAEQALDRMNIVREAMDVSEYHKGKMDTFDSDYSAWITSAEKAISLAKNGNMAEVESLISSETYPAFQTLREHYDEVGSYLKEEANKTAQSSANQSNTLSLSLIIAIIVVTLISIACIVYGPLLVTSRLKEITNAINEINDGEGDLTARLSEDGKDELTDLSVSFNSLMENLQMLIKAIGNDNIELSSSVERLNASSEQNTSIVNEQSKNLSNIAVSVNELAQTCRGVVENTQSIKSNITSVKEMSAQSIETVAMSVTNSNSLNEKVSHASSVIKKLADESQSILSVLDVIKSIAEQTNLLALNAAIEAARAGEQGRGFAVVADEVRTLASRTQQSTEDINRMLGGLEKGVNEAVNAIEDGNSQVDKVVEISGKLESFLAEVDSTIVTTSELISHISIATEHQNTATEEINNNVSQLHELSIKSVDAADTASEEAAKVNQSTLSLKSKIKRFKV